MPDISWDKIINKPFGDLIAGTPILDVAVTIGNMSFPEDNISQTLLPDGSASQIDFIINDRLFNIIIGDKTYSGIGTRDESGGDIGIYFVDSNGNQIGFFMFIEGMAVLILMSKELDGTPYNVKVTLAEPLLIKLDAKYLPEEVATKEDINAPQTEFILNSSTAGSTKQFKITIDDNGVLTATEIINTEA